MPRLKTARKLKLAGRMAQNLLRGKPITISFEITYNCNADCRHCHLGAAIKEQRAGAGKFGQRIAELSPVIVQLSGGEPLMRRDAFAITEELRRRDPLAVFVMTTNAHLLDEEKYLQLRRVGLDQLSISLDFPDERHDDFRRIRGNFAHLCDLVPKLAAHRNDDIVLACVVQSENYRELPRLAELARSWGVQINFSIYTHLRTHNRELLISPDGQLDALREIVERLIEMQRDGYPIVTSPYSLHKMTEFYATGTQPDCQAGRRFLIVNPQGELAPCGMMPEYFDTLDELQREFTDKNQCTLCYTASRANSEKPLGRMILDGMRVVKK